MKKSALSLIASVLLFSNLTYSQLTSPHFISVNIGTSLPLSDFKEADSIATGGANTGLYYSFEAGAYFSKLFGIALNVGQFSNAVDEESIEEQLRREFNSNGTFTINTDSWVNGYIMIGPILSIGNEKFIVDAKFLAGLMNSTKPFISVQSDLNNTETAINQSNEVTASSFGFNYGINFRIKLVGKLGLRINAESFLSNQEFESEVKRYDTNSNTEVITSEKLEKQIQTLNLGMGLILTF